MKSVSEVKEELIKVFKQNFPYRAAPNLEEFYISSLNQISQATEAEVIQKIDSFDLVVDCQPDCTPEQHAYHKGTWDAHIKLQEILDSLSPDETQVKKEEKGAK